LTPKELRTSIVIPVAVGLLSTERNNEQGIRRSTILRDKENVFPRWRPWSLIGFLRNLTPQAVSLSFAFVEGSKLDFGTWDFSNAPATVIFYTLAATCVMAAWANCTPFIEKCVAGSNRIERGMRLLTRKRRLTNLKRSRVAMAFNLELQQGVLHGVGCTRVDSSDRVDCCIHHGDQFRGCLSQGQGSKDEVIAVSR